MPRPVPVTAPQLTLKPVCDMPLTVGVAIGPGIIRTDKGTLATLAVAFIAVTVTLLYVWPAACPVTTRDVVVTPVMVVLNPLMV